MSTVTSANEGFTDDVRDYGGFVLRVRGVGGHHVGAVPVGRRLCAFEEHRIAAFRRSDVCGPVAPVHRILGVTEGAAPVRQHCEGREPQGRNTVEGAAHRSKSSWQTCVLR